VAPLDVLGWYTLSWHYIEPLWEKVREIIKEDTRETAGQKTIANGHTKSAIAEEEATNVVG
jgi:hypothetical protein